MGPLPIIAGTVGLAVLLASRGKSGAAGVRGSDGLSSGTVGDEVSDADAVTTELAPGQVVETGGDAPVRVSNDGAGTVVKPATTSTNPTTATATAGDQFGAVAGDVTDNLITVGQTFGDAFGFLFATAPKSPLTPEAESKQTTLLAPSLGMRF